jgi:hypothetical protein
MYCIVSSPVGLGGDAQARELAYGFVVVLATLAGIVPGDWGSKVIGSSE